MGTKGGAIYLYGDGFQFIRPWLIADPNEVVSIVALYPNKILVTYLNDSMVAMVLPTLDVIDLLQQSWLPTSDGEITVQYSDLPGEKGFVYVGTSEGVLLVLDVTVSAIRICDYRITPADFGLPHKMPITDIKSNPRDEKFLAVSFGGDDLDEGAIAIFDLQKHKAYRTIKTNAIRALEYQHINDVLYAGK